MRCTHACAPINREMEGGVEGGERDGGDKGDEGCGEEIKWNVTAGSEDN